MRAWSTWLPDLLPQVRMLPRLVAEQFVLRAAQDATERSRAWIVRSESIEVLAGSTDLELTFAEADVELVRIERAYLDGKPLSPSMVGDMVDLAGEDWRSTTGAPTHIVQLSPWSVRLYPTPLDDAATGLSADCALRPSEASSGLPDDVAERLRQAIGRGAVARLLLLSGRPWSDPKLGAAYMAEYNGFIAAANWAATKGHGRASVRRPSISWF